MIHAGTPPERVKILSDALVQAMQSDRFKKYLTDSGLDPETSVAGSEVWDAQLKEMYAKEKAVIDELGLRSEEQTSELQSLMRISYAVFCLKTKKLCISSESTTSIHTYHTLLN